MLLNAFLFRMLSAGKDCWYLINCDKCQPICNQFYLLKGTQSLKRQSSGYVFVGCFTLVRTEDATSVFRQLVIFSPCLQVRRADDRRCTIFHRCDRDRHAHQGCLHRETSNHQRCGISSCLQNWAKLCGQNLWNFVVVQCLSSLSSRIEYMSSWCEELAKHTESIHFWRIRPRIPNTKKATSKPSAASVLFVLCWSLWSWIGSRHLKIFPQFFLILSLRKGYPSPIPRPMANVFLRAVWLQSFSHERKKSLWRNWN